jgi:response regulator RpfG family c-di-GMP phosphodiesterase
MHAPPPARVNPKTVRPPTTDAQVSPGQRLLRELLASSIIRAEEWEALPAEVQEGLRPLDATEPLLARLVELNLLNDYQAARVGAGKTFGLILGNYRVLGRLGTGGMGVVFKAEHLRMRRQVAIKVLPLHSRPEDPHYDQQERMLLRFYAEIRSAAQLQHPNIVAAIDVGELTPPDPDAPVLHYFVMEYVPGQDLEEYVRGNGPLPQVTACDLMHQVASALAEAHKHGLIHRDIKPSNVLVTPEGQAKLLDFGLARNFRHRLTEPGTVLGTIDYMAPEQARDASAVDIRADLYALGGVLFWCLTGRPPFPGEGNMAQGLARRLTQPPPSLRAARPELPAELEAVVARLMALDPDDRYATPQAVMRALLPFVRAESREPFAPPPAGNAVMRVNVAAAAPAAQVHRILVADDEAGIRTYCRYVLTAEGLRCDEAANGAEALAAVGGRDYDLVLLDIDMPEMTGLEVLRRLREAPASANLKILMFSGRASADEMAQTLLAGADDYLTKPFSVVQLQARVRSMLRLKSAQDRLDAVNRNLLSVNSELERSLTARNCDLVHARNALVLALAKLVQSRDTETGAHLVRLQRYSRCLAEEAATVPAFASRIDPAFVEMLECCAPLHDIGKVGLPDHILLKPGKLDAEERLQMQAHTVIGSDTLRQVAQQHGAALAFLQMGTDIARHHHER